MAILSYRLNSLKSRPWRLLAQFKTVLVLIAIGMINHGCVGDMPAVLGNANGPLFSTIPPPNEGSALLYIYRPERFGSGLATPLVYINSEKALFLNNNGYAVLELTPGGFVIETRHSGMFSQGPELSLWFVAKPGRTYYIQSIASTGFGSSAFPLLFVSEETALKEIRNTRQLTPFKDTFDGQGRIGGRNPHARGE